jgi:DNA-binding NarL/FixJ family response regulator
MSGLTDSTIAIISDQPLLREALAGLVQLELRPRQLDLYPKVSDFRRAADHRPDLLLYDPPPELDFRAALQLLAEAATKSHALLLIPRPDPVIARLARSYGFRGVLPRTSEPAVMAAALRLVMAGGEYFPCFDMEEPPAATPSRTGLTRRQGEILAELGAGASNKEIARKLNISVATVKLHVRALMNIAAARNRTQVVIRLRDW